MPNNDTSQQVDKALSRRDNVDREICIRGTAETVRYACYCYLLLCFYLVFVVSSQWSLSSNCTIAQWCSASGNPLPALMKSCFVLILLLFFPVVSLRILLVFGQPAHTYSHTSHSSHTQIRVLLVFLLCDRKGSDKREREREGNVVFTLLVQ